MKPRHAAALALVGWNVRCWTVMSETANTAYLPAGTEAPSTGIYLVTHHNPSHSPAHEVRVSRLMVLPKCSACDGARFSLRSYLIEAIEQNEFFHT
jgi:hypothetical protein